MDERSLDGSFARRILAWRRSETATVSGAKQPSSIFQLTAPPGVRLGKLLRSAASSRGWTVTEVPSTVADLSIALSPPTDVHAFAGQPNSIAVVTEDVVEWTSSGALDAAQIVVCSSDRVQRMVDSCWAQGIAQVEPTITNDRVRLFDVLLDLSEAGSAGPVIGVSSCARRWDQAEYWGDTYLARGLIRAFRRRGLRAYELVRTDWDEPRARQCDVVIHLRGLTHREVSDDQIDVLWIISHPERVDRSELDAYDIIAVASSSDAERLAEETGRPVHFLPQAADADTFRLGFLDPALRDDVIYVGSARQPRRRGPRWLTDLEIPFKLFGQNWDEPPEADHVVEEFVPNRRLASLYRSAAVVVNDHHDAMRTAGYVSNRVFDVLAAGGLVVSDDVEGLHEILGDAVPTYRDAEQLRLCVGGFVADPGERSRRARSGRSIVIDAHTLDHRAEHFLSLIAAYSQTYADT